MKGGAMSNSNRVAVVQAGSVPFDLESIVEKATRLIQEAGAGGAKLALFPEAFVGGQRMRLQNAGRRPTARLTRHVLRLLRERYRRAKL
jgi:predicted amidohydrolase